MIKNRDLQSCIEEKNVFRLKLLVKLKCVTLGWAKWNGVSMWASAAINLVRRSAKRQGPRIVFASACTYGNVHACSPYCFVLSVFMTIIISTQACIKHHFDWRTLVSQCWNSYNCLLQHIHVSCLATKSWKKSLVIWKWSISRGQAVPWNLLEFFCCIDYDWKASIFFSNFCNNPRKIEHINCSTF